MSSADSCSFISLFLILVTFISCLTALAGTYNTLLNRIGHLSLLPNTKEESSKLLHSV